MNDGLPEVNPPPVPVMKPTPPLVSPVPSEAPKAGEATTQTPPEITTPEQAVEATNVAREAEVAGRNRNCRKNYSYPLPN